MHTTNDIPKAFIVNSPIPLREDKDEQKSIKFKPLYRTSIIYSKTGDTTLKHKKMKLDN